MAKVARNAARSREAGSSKNTRSDAYWIVDRRQLECLASPMRQDILDRLAASGAMAVGELAVALGVKQTALYRHLAILEDAGLVLKAGSRTKNRKSETLYAAPARRLLLEKAFQTRSNAPALATIAAALTRQLGRDAARALAAGGGATSGPQRTLGFARRIGAPTAKELAEINRKLADISAILRRRGGNRGPLVAFGWVMAPVGERRAKGRA